MPNAFHCLLYRNKVLKIAQNLCGLCGGLYTQIAQLALSGLNLWVFDYNTDKKFSEGKGNHLEGICHSPRLHVQPESAKVTRPSVFAGKI